MTSCNIQKKKVQLFHGIFHGCEKRDTVRSGLPQTYSLRYRDLVAILMNKSQKSGISCVSQCLPRCYID